MAQQLDWALGGGRGWKRVFRGKEAHGIWQQTPPPTAPGLSNPDSRSLAPCISTPLTTRNPQDKPCPRRAVPLRLWWADPAFSMELTQCCFSVIQIPGRNRK